MGIAKLESFLEDHIEGFFNRKFLSPLEPAEIRRKLEREALRQIKKEADGEFLPNGYVLYLNPEDYKRLCSQRLTDELYEYMERLTISNGAFMDGDLRLRLAKDETLKPGMQNIEFFFGAEEIPKEDTAPVTEKPGAHTIVLERSAFQKPLNLPKKRDLATLTVQTGADQGSTLTLGEGMIYIGRREKNDFILTDENVSRVHAYVEFSRHRHVIRDAGSLNGTYVNDERQTFQVLSVGDRITLGQTVLLYEVLN